MPQNPTPHDGYPSAGDPYVPTSGNTGYLVEHYEIDLDYRVTTNRLTATAIITARSTQELDRFSLDVAGLVVDRVTIDGEAPRKTTRTARKLTLSMAERLAAGQEFVVTVKYHGTPRPMRSEWGDVGWEELTDGVLVASQPNGASSWFPCNDHPSNKATFDIAITCESIYAVVSNGALVSKVVGASRSTWTFSVREPMATYLATVQIGRYRSRQFGTEPVTTVHYPQHLAANVAVDFSRVDEMIAVFSDLFGPYPFESYGVIVTADELEIPLEAHGLAIFGRNHVDGAHGSDRLIAHELAHQWFGNSLTVSLWKDIWLQEGFACYAEWLWAEASGGLSAHENARKHWRLVNEQEKDIVVGDPGAKLLFDDRVYKRGALGIHAVRREIGDTAFFDGLRRLNAERRYSNIEPGEVVEALSTGPRGRRVRPIIDRWIYSAPLPLLR